MALDCVTNPRWGGKMADEASSKQDFDLAQEVVNMHERVKIMARGIISLESSLGNVKQAQDLTQQSIMQLKQNMPIFTRDGKGTASSSPTLKEIDELIQRRLAPLAESMEGIERETATMADLKNAIPGSTAAGSRDGSVVQADELAGYESRPGAKASAAAGTPLSAMTSMFSREKTNPNDIAQLHESIATHHKALVAEIQKERMVLLEHISNRAGSLTQNASPLSQLVQNRDAQSTKDWASPNAFGLSVTSTDQSAMRPKQSSSPLLGLLSDGQNKDDYDQQYGMPVASPPLEQIPEVSQQGNAPNELSCTVLSLDSIDGAIDVNGAGAAPTASAEAEAKVEDKEKLVVEEWATDDPDEDEPVGPIVLKDTSSLGSVFCNDDDVHSPPYDVTEYYYKTGYCQAVARSNRFANLTVFVVMLNAVYIGVDADWNNAENIFDADYFFMISSNFFCVYFTGELLIRGLAFRKKMETLKDGWFKFDLFLVATMILDTWIVMSIMKLQTGADQVSIPVQPLRMLRLFKLTRMARLMKAFPELVTMIKGLIRSLRAISSSGILVALMVYTWAILMHMLMKDEDDFNRRLQEDSKLDFTTITNCMWTLLMDGTLMLDNSAPLMTELLFSKKNNFIIAGIFFVSYCVLSALLILQMLIGVLCDVVSQVGQEQRDAHDIGIMKQELLAIITQFDGGDGRISQPELIMVMKHKKSVAVLKKLNINRPFVMELQKMMFPKPNSTVPINDILQLLVMCRGDNMATVETLAGGFSFLASELEDVKHEMVNQIITQQPLPKPDGRKFLRD